MSEPDMETLRSEVSKSVTALRRRQRMTWEFMMNDVHAASEKFSGVRNTLIEERVRDLAAGTHPTLLESVIGLVVVAFPFAAVTRSLLSHWSRSMQIGKVVGVLGADAKHLETFKHIDKVLQAEARQFSGQARAIVGKRPTQIAFVRDTVEYNANLQKFSDLYGIEIASSARALVKSAAEKAAKPVVSQDRIFDPKEPKKDGPPADASDYLKGVRDWIVRSKNAEDVVLEDMEKQSEKTQDRKQLEAIQAFIQSDIFIDKTLTVDYDREAFQRYVEMCLWCTTWDFRPKWIPASRANPVAGRAMVLPHFEAPPLGEKFWKFACDRYYDPFFGDGTRTYSEIGRSRQIGEGPAPPLPSEVAAHYGAKGADEAFGQYPSERLAYNWGNVIAPRLLNLNKELGEALERQLRIDKKQMSEPSELDVFNQYLMGLRKVEK
jgi:hypothetical protein